MNTRCTVCHDPQRAAIEQAHLDGTPYRELAQRFGRSRTTIQQHIKAHLPNAAQKALRAADGREIAAGDRLLADINDLRHKAEALRLKAEKKGDLRTAMQGIRELGRLIELMARMLGEIRDREISITNVQIDPATADRMAQIWAAQRMKTGVQPVGPLLEVTGRIEHE